MSDPPAVPQADLVDEPEVAHGVLVMLVVGLVSAIAISGSTIALGWPHVPRATIAASAAILLALALARSGRIKPAVLVALVGTGAAVLYGAARNNGIHNIGLVILPVLIAMAGLLLSRRASAIFSAAAILGVAAMLAIRYYGTHAQPYHKANLGDFFIFAITCMATAVLSRHLSARIQAGFGLLRAGEQRYRRIFDNVQDGYYEMGADGVLLELSPAGAGMFGAPREAMIGRSLAEFCEDPAPFDALMAALEERGRVSNRELAVRNSRGETVQLLVHASFRDDTENGGRRITGSLRDITEWRRAEEALRESETRLRLAAEATGVGTFDFYPQTEKLVWSDVTKRQFGMPPDAEVDHDTFLRVVHPDDRALIRQAQAAASDPTGDGRLAVEYRVTGGDGKQRWISVRGRMFFDRERRPRRLIGTTLDITARKQAEAALRESAETARRRAEELERLMDVVPVAIFVSRDPECRSITGNRAADELCEVEAGRNISAGTARGEVLDTERHFFTGDRQLNPSELPMQAAATHGAEIRDFEMELSLPSGSRRTVLGNAIPLRDGEGRVRGCVGAFLDITDRKQLEEELRRRAEELETIMNVAPVAIFVAHDPDCHSVTGNRFGNALLEAGEGSNLSVTPREGAGPSHRFFQDGVELTAGKRPLEIAGAGADVRDCEMEVVLPGGGKRWFWGHASPLRDAGGRIRGAVGAFQDVTAARQRTAEQLRESEERFRATADAAPVIMWLSDAEGRLTWVNKEASRFSGQPAGALLAEKWAAMIHPEDRKAARAARRAAFARHAPYQIEARARRADGEYRDMLSTAGPRFVGSEYAGHAGSIVDITELKRRQVVDLTRQKWQSLGTLAGGIAHDFNNLLGGILAQAELAAGELAAGRSPHQELKAIGHVARTGSEIVRQLMMYAGREAKAHGVVSISQIVREMADLLKLSVSKHVALETGLHMAVPGVRADAAQIGQVVMNLVTNASDAIGTRDGTIRIVTGPRTVEPDEAAAAGVAPGEYVQLEVADDGCGMPPEVQARVFDPFYTTKSAGHGLGLAVVHGIVQGLGGSVRIHSTAGKGTTFQVLLPAAKTAAAAAAAGEGTPRTEEPAAPRREPAVLVVEDEDPLRQAVVKFLRRSGFEVMEAESGSDAIDLLRAGSGKVDVILLDMTIPGASSREVAAEAARLRPGITVVLTSAYSEEMVAPAVREPHVRGFLRKPFPLRELVQTLRDAAGG